jgi:hypothetical protein
VCVRFFTPILDEPCQYIPSQPGGRSNCPHVDERCVCDLSNSDGTCMDVNQAHCAPESSERRWCQHVCGSDGDCRADYQCRSTGTLGAEPVPPRYDAGVPVTMPAGTPARFCAPAG